MSIVHFFQFVWYLISLYWLGWVIMRRWCGSFPVLLKAAGAILSGTAIGVPVTYAFAYIFAKTSNPIEWGTGLFIALSMLIAWVSRRNTPVVKHEVSAADVGLIVFALAFSSWLMFKTFHGGAAGQLFVGSNNVFDFGFVIGLVRSVSWGANIPLASPFFSGAPIFYHFMFAFWVALWEYFGVPIVWAMNIPSVMSFASLLIIVYFLPQVLWKQPRLVGWIGVLLTITNSTTTFWKLLATHGFSSDLISTVWRLPAYPFRGPFDGSVISIFTTLNNYVNQRHLSFSIALGLLLFMAVHRFLTEKKNPGTHLAVCGILTGLLWIWNMPVSCVGAAAIVGLLAIRRVWQNLAAYAAGWLFGMAIVLIPSMPDVGSVVAFIRLYIAAGANESRQLAPGWTAIEYLWNNLGILPIAAVIGLMALPKRTRLSALPLLLLFIIQCIAAVLGHRGFDQKFFSFLIIGVNVYAAAGIGWLLTKRRVTTYVFALVLFFTLTISGVVDLMAVKNEFAFPLISRETVQLISWIQKETPKASVFASYADIIDPVVLAGRKNYFGFFGNIGWYDRSSLVRDIYGGNLEAASASDISYVLVPKEVRTDFPYAVDEKELRADSRVVYEDMHFYVVALKR